MKNFIEEHLSIAAAGNVLKGLHWMWAHLGVLGKIQVMTALFRIIFWRFLRRLRTCKMPCLGCLGAIQIQRDLERFLGPWSSISLGELSPRIFQITGYSDSPWWSFSICERTYSPLMAGWFRNLDKSGTSNSPVEGTVVEISQEFFVFTVFFLTGFLNHQQYHPMECEECVNYRRLERIFLVCYTVCSKPDLFFVLMVKWPFQRWHGGPLLNHLGPDHFKGHDSKFHKIPVVINQPGFHRSFFFPVATTHCHESGGWNLYSARCTCTLTYLYFGWEKKPKKLEKTPNTFQQFSRQFITSTSVFFLKPQLPMYFRPMYRGIYTSIY